MTPQRTLPLSIAAFVLAVVSLIVAGLYATGVTGSGQKLAPTDRSSRTGSLRTEGNLHVDRNAMVSGTLDVTGPTTINDLIANGPARLSSLHGTGAAQFESTLTATQGIFTVGTGRPPLVVNSNSLVPNLFASNSALLAGQPSNYYIDVSGSGQSKAGGLSVGSLTSGGLGITGAGSVSGPFTVGGQTTLNGSLTVPGTATLGTLSTTGNGTIGGNTTVGGNLTVNGSSTLAQLNLKNLSVANDVAVGGKLTVGGATAINNNLTVAGAATLRGGVAVTGNANVSGNIGAGGTVTAGSGLIATTGGLKVGGGGATITGNSSVTGDLGVTGTINSNTLVAATGNITTVNSTTGNIGTVNGKNANFVGLTTLGLTSLSCPGGSPMALNVCGDAQVSGNLTTGNLINTGSFTATGVINANGGISTSNGGPLNLTGANATVAVTGLLTAGNGATVNGGLLTANQGATVNGGLLTANLGATVNGGPLAPGNSLTLDGTGTTVTGLANLQGATTVGTMVPGCSTGAQLTVCGDMSTSGQITAGGTAHLNGGITAAGGTVTVAGNLTTGASNGTLTGFQLISTVASTCPLLGFCGLAPTPPLAVNSHDVVTNLNSNFLQGHPASDFSLGAGLAPATGSTSYIQNCSVVGNSCPQAANVNLTNTGLAGNPMTAVLTSSVAGVDALQVTGGAAFNGATAFSGGLATFKGGLMVAAGQPTTINGGITVAQAGSTIFQTAANSITFGVPGPLTSFIVNATNTGINGDAVITGNATITRDLIGGNFAGACVVTAADVALFTTEFTCQTQITGQPKAVVITPGFGGGGAYFVDNFAVAGPGPNLGKGNFVAHFPSATLVAGNTVYYVVVR